MSESRLATDLVGWVVSPAVCWVRRSGLALVLVRRGEALLGAQRITSRQERMVGAALLGRCDRALAGAALWEVAELAAAFASWAAGDQPVGLRAVEDRVVDLTLRAGVVASDGRRLALLRERPVERLGGAFERCAQLARALAGRPAGMGGLLALDLEDRAARFAGEALIAVLLAGERA